jgi:phosphoribosylformimino-5-aminoimidazole carboxamide ribotide isomerase
LEVIPSIDVRGGIVVRLEQGDYARETVYDADPVAVARRLAGHAPPRLHLVDLDAARTGEPVNDGLLREMTRAAAPVPVQVGGGVRSVERIEALIAAGVDRVVLGTAALERPEFLRDSARRFPGRIVLGIDAREGKLAVRGWTETLDATPEDVLRRHQGLPLAAALYTEIGRDGLLSGPDVEGTAKLARASVIPVIASGGVGRLDDLLELARTRVIAGAIVGRAIYSGSILLEDALREVGRC